MLFAKRVLIVAKVLILAGMQVLWPMVYVCAIYIKCRTAILESRMRPCPYSVSVYEYRENTSQIIVRHVRINY
jgi:hypothetical protein